MMLGRGSLLSIKNSQSPSPDVEGAHEKRKRGTIDSFASLDLVNSGFDWKNVSTPQVPPTSKRRKSTLTHHEPSDWEKYRAHIEELYGEHELSAVKDIMEKEHGFHASVPQYKQKLGKWGVSKYTKFSRKQLLYIAQEVVRRGGQDKGTAFRHNGKRLNSRNVERAMKRNVKEEDPEVASLASAMSSCGLSGYTSSTRGVRISWLSRLGSTYRMSQAGDVSSVIEEEEEEGEEPVLAQALVKINHVDRKDDRSGETRIVRTDKIDPLSMNSSVSDSCHFLLDQALETVRGNRETGIDCYVKGLHLPEEIKLTLIFFHLTGSFSHAEPFTAFRVKNVFRTIQKGRKTIKTKEVDREKFEIECAWCGHARELKVQDDIEAVVMKGGVGLGISHREQYNMWSDEMLSQIRSFIYAHEEFDPWWNKYDPKKNRGIPKIAGYLREWDAVDVATQTSPDDLLPPPEKNVRDSFSDQATVVSLSEIMVPDLWGGESATDPSEGTCSPEDINMWWEEVRIATMNSKRASKASTIGTVDRGI